MKLKEWFGSKEDEFELGEDPGWLDAHAKSMTLLRKMEDLRADVRDAEEAEVQAKTALDTALAEGIANGQEEPERIDGLRRTHRAAEERVRSAKERQAAAAAAQRKQVDLAKDALNASRKDKARKLRDAYLVKVEKQIDMAAELKMLTDEIRQLWELGDRQFSSLDRNTIAEDVRQELSIHPHEPWPKLWMRALTAEAGEQTEYERLVSRWRELGLDV